MPEIVPLPPDYPALVCTARNKRMRAKLHRMLDCILDQAAPSVAPGVNGEYGVKIHVRNGSIQKLSQTILIEDTREPDA